MKKKKITYGEKVRHLRTLLGLTQEDFASESEISTSLLSKIESGNQEPSVRFKVLMNGGLGWGCKKIHPFFDTNINRPYRNPTNITLRACQPLKEINSGN